jgi:transcription elongation GreA/GreB family factor
MMVNKSAIIDFLMEQQIERTAELQLYTKDLSDALGSEQKSTAGDKHETGRAMIHLKMEKSQHQLQAIDQMKGQLSRIRAAQQNGQVGFGSVIVADRDTFLVGVGLGKQVILGKVVYCLGMDAPIAKGLMGRKIGESIFFNGNHQQIVEIL